MSITQDHKPDGAALPNTFRRDCREGFKDTLSIFLAIFPFGALFGAAAIAQGLSVAEAVFASATMFAGASQYVMLEVMGLQVPAWSVALSVFAVNFRHILYSASIGRKLTQFSGFQKAVAFFLLTDVQWAATESRYEKTGITPAYYFSFGLVLYVEWLVATWVGAQFGSLIDDPVTFGFDLLLPVYFLTLLMGFRQRPRWLSIVLISGIASILVYLTLGAPWHISIGALFGIGAAALMPIENQDLSAGSREGVNNG